MPLPGISALTPTLSHSGPDCETGRTSWERGEKAGLMTGPPCGGTTTETVVVFRTRRGPVMTKKKTESGKDRLKALPLWQWGAIVIFAGMISNFVMGFQPVSPDPAAARGQELGRGLVTASAVIVGIGMILRDVFRKQPESKKQLKKRKNVHE